MSNPLLQILKINRLGLELTPRESGKANGKEYKFNTLSDVQKLLAPVLELHKLYLLQEVSADEGFITISTQVYHDEDMEGEAYTNNYKSIYKTRQVQLQNLTSSQSDASVITNTRKNVLKSIFGIVSHETEESNDGAGNEIKQKILMKGSNEENLVIKDFAEGKINETEIRAKYKTDETQIKNIIFEASLIQ